MGGMFDTHTRTLIPKGDVYTNWTRHSPTALSGIDDEINVMRKHNGYMHRYTDIHIGRCTSTSNGNGHIE